MRKIKLNKSVYFVPILNKYFNSQLIMSITLYGSKSKGSNQSLRFLPSPFSPPLRIKLNAKYMKITNMNPRFNDNKIKWNTMK